MPNHHFQDALEHLVRMARLPWAIDQARHSCKLLEQTDLYAGISKAVAEQLSRAKELEQEYPGMREALTKVMKNETN